MLSKVINSQGFSKAICNHIDITDPFNHKLTIIDQYSEIILLNINIFGSRLGFGIFGEDDASLVIFV